MKRRVFHEVVDIVTTHRDNNLFSRWTFGCHLDARFWFILAVDNAVNLIDLFGIEGWEGLFDFEYFQCVGGRFGGLGVRFAIFLIIFVLYNLCF